MNYLELAKASSPELCMTALALGVLLLDGLALRAWDAARRAKVLGYLTALGLGVTVWLVLGQIGEPQRMVDGRVVLFSDPSHVLVLDGLALTLKLVILLLTIGTVLLSVGYEFTKHVGEYFCLVVFAAIGMNILVATENLLMFFVALELLSVCLYILTAFHKGLLRSAEAAMKYFMFGALSSAFLLFGLSYLVGLTGATTMTSLASAVNELMADGAAPPMLLIVGLLFVIVGVGFKIAVVPFHLWAPDAYEGAPTPVAAFIATGSKVASFVVGGKILWVGLGGMAGSASISMRELTRGGGWESLGFSAGWTMVLALVATVSMIWGNVAAIAQRNVKRLLAYSSIAHAGYILVGMIAMNELGVSAVLFYLVVYGLTNLGAFGVIAALTRAAGGDDIEDLDGMAQRSPLMSALLLIFLLSLAGIPPLAGFFGKFYLFAAAVGADPRNLGLLWLVTIAIITSAISLYYYLVVLKHVYVLPPRRAEPVRCAIVWNCTLAIIAIGVLALGIWPAALVDVFDSLASNISLTAMRN